MNTHGEAAGRPATGVAAELTAALTQAGPSGPDQSGMSSMTMDIKAANTTDMADSVAAGTRIYWCICGWSGSGLVAIEDHLDRYDDGTDAHVEMAE
jgi:hypothetical protein